MIPMSSPAPSRAITARRRRFCWRNPAPPMPVTASASRSPRTIAECRRPTRASPTSCSSARRTMAKRRSMPTPRRPASTPARRPAKRLPPSRKRRLPKSRKKTAAAAGSMAFSKFGVLGALIAAAFLGSASAPAQESKAFQFALQTGMQVLVVPDHRAPVVTQMLWYRVGAVDDPPGIGGLAHFFEHMMFRGTTANPGGAFSLTVARNGGEDNAFTTHDYTAFYEQIAKDRLRTVMGLEADRIANLDLSDANVRTEREAVLEERRTRIDNDPQSLMREQMEAALHLTHPYGRPVIGWPDEIRRIGRVEASDFYTHHYAPNNAILVVAGDVTPQEVRAAAEAEYGKLPARELVTRWEFAQPARLGENRL